MIASLRFLNALTKLLAGLSVYGLVACGVNRVEAIRIHMSRDKGNGMVLGLCEVMRPVPLAAVALAAIAEVLSRNLSASTSVRLLWGVGLSGPVSFLLVPGFLLSVALLASYVPARRATHVDPRLALRHEWV
jgi:putative ABC transport system permease protein